MGDMEVARKEVKPSIRLELQIMESPLFQQASRNVTNISDKANLERGVRGITTATTEIERKKAVGEVGQIAEKYKFDSKLRAHLTTDLAAATSARAEVINRGNQTQANQIAAMYLQGGTANDIINKMDDWGYKRFAEEERTRQTKYQAMLSGMIANQRAPAETGFAQTVPIAILKSIEQQMRTNQITSERTDKEREKEYVSREGEVETRKREKKKDKEEEA